MDNIPPSQTNIPAVPATSRRDFNRPLWAVATLVFAGIMLLGWANEGTPPLIRWLAVVGFVMSGVGMIWIGRHAARMAKTVWEMEAETQRLRNARERARAIYELSTTLSATLDYNRVLEAVHEVGLLGMREISADSSRMVSAVLLFRSDDPYLHVTTARRLTRPDEKIKAAGREGVLGEALKTGEPAFGKDANRDPELRYFVGFQGCNSLLAIPLRAGFENFGVLVFGSDQQNAFAKAAVALLTAIGTQATIALQNAVLYQNLLTEKERIVAIEEDARKKLQRDLHDGPTQTISLVATRLSLIQMMLKRNQLLDAADELKKSEELAIKTTKEIRHMLFTLRPLVLETQGLVAALQELAGKLKERYQIEIIVEAEQEIERWLEANAQGVLFYIVEEAWNNALKHARAAHLWARLYRKNDQYVIVDIQDDGIGFDVKAVTSNYHKRGSFGMVNMHERAELINSTLHIDSAKGKGTKISVLIPLGQDTRPTAAVRDERRNDRPTFSERAPAPGETRIAARLLAHKEEGEADAPPGWADLVE